jgi:hypothetical protein
MSDWRFRSGECEDLNLLKCAEVPAADNCLKQETKLWMWALRTVYKRCISLQTCVVVLYIKLKVCLFVCLFVPYIKIHISEPIWTKLCTNLPLRLEETVGYVWSENVWPFATFLTFFVGNECRILGTTWLPAQDFRDSVICVILAGVSVTSRKWRWSRRHLPRVIRGSVIFVVLAGVSVTSRKWCTKRQLTRVIRDNVISVILAGVGVTSRKWRSRRHLRVLTGSVVHYG